MYPSISSRTRKVELATDDIEGIQTLYGSNPNFNGSSAQSVQERETGSGSGSGAAHCVHSRWGLTGKLGTLKVQESNICVPASTNFLSYLVCLQRLPP
ncbi:hypothetical protein NC652_034151 [Populus alba x Populus x berolinensis]|nr:hypothetical protein NC652_034151 [Populus alba x Populus x berolinensis]